MNLKNVTKSLQILFNNRLYLLLVFIVTLGFGYVLYLLSNFSMLLYMDSKTFIFFSLGMSVLIAILFGINVSLIVYKFNQSKKMGLKENSSSILGLIGGSFGSGCPICGTTLIGLLGVSGGLAILPFKGLELKLLSIGLLLFSTYNVSESIFNYKPCKLKGSEK